MEQKNLVSSPIGICTSQRLWSSLPFPHPVIRPHRRSATRPCLRTRRRATCALWTPCCAEVSANPSRQHNIGAFLNVNCLCTTGAWPDAFKSDNGFTAIVAASANGHDKVVSRLLEGGTAGAAELDQQTRVRALAERPLHLSLQRSLRLIPPPLAHTNPLPILQTIGFREYVRSLQSCKDPSEARPSANTDGSHPTHQLWRDATHVFSRKGPPLCP
jgi:hypothetical protein